MSRDGNSEKPGFVQRLGRGVQDRVKSVRNAAADTIRSTGETIRNAADRAARRVEGPRVSYQGALASVEFQIDVVGGTMWATQQQMADLFGVERSVITKHVQNVFSDNELEDGPATCAKIAQVRVEGSREVTREIEHYSLDMIIAVGYRVSSRQATEFRRWATDKLSAYIRDGFVVNERRLREDPVAAQSAAEKIRELRYSEANLYSRVRDAVVMVASDYDGTADHVRQFFARMQDKFHYAACERTAQQILLSRADGTKDHMGMTCRLNTKPTLKDAHTAKNYLSDQELKLQMIAGDLFFSFVENMIVRGRTMTTAQLLAKIDEVFKFGEMPQFPGYVGPYIKPHVDAHVRKQYDLFKSRTDRERYDAAHRQPRT